MPFETETLDDIKEKVREKAANLRRLCNAAATQMQSENVSANLLLNARDMLYDIKQKMETVVSKAGASPGQTFDDLKTAVENAIAVIETGFPREKGYLLKEQFTAGGGTTVRKFTPEQTGDFVTALQAVVAAIA